MRKKRSKYSGTAQRRERIIHAGLACFNDMGFVNTTMEDIRLRSNSSNGSIYHHFKSKEQLASAIYLEGINNYQAGLLSGLEKSRGAQEGIFAIIDYHLRWASENQGWARFLSNMRHAEFLVDKEASIKQANSSFGRTIWQFFTGHIKEGTLKPLAGELYVSIILGPCHEFSRHWLNHTFAVDLDAVTREFADAAWQALRRK